jgi:D-sedoheptulose 7-phosphate isomerase|tara:strand:+ start:346 stop:924 length:579 start_codon:yes stop_codon:yes gene_type:complete
MRFSIKNYITKYLDESLKVAKIQNNLIDQIENITELILKSLKAGNKLLICGNGGSASDSQHFAAEFVGRFKNDKKPLAAIALTTDSSILTSIGNDYGFEYIFSKQVEALGKKDDVLIVISTSGSSPNIINALIEGKNKGLLTISFVGNNKESIESLSDIYITIPSEETGVVQQAHITLLQVIAGAVEYSLIK